MFRKILVTIQFLGLIFFSGFVSSESSHDYYINYDTHSYSSAIGINSHLNFKVYNSTRKNNADALKDLGTKIVRIDWQGISLNVADIDLRKKDFDEAICWLLKNGIEPLIVVPLIPKNVEDKTLANYSDLIKYLATRYDGHHKIYCDGEYYSPKVIYYQIGNEIDAQRKRGGFELINNPRALWLINKTGALTVKRYRQDAKVIMGALTGKKCSIEYLNWLRQYKEKKISIGSLFDIIAVNVYTETPKLIDQFYFSFKKMFNGEHDLLKKKIWVTECGYSTYKYKEKQQAAYLAPTILTHLSNGAEKVFWYVFRDMGGNYYDRVDTQNCAEDYYGLIRPSVMNGYVSFLANNSKDSLLSVGEALTRVYVGFPWTNRNYVDLTLPNESDELVRELKLNGLIIKCNDGDISKVVRLHSFKERTDSGAILYDNGEKTVVVHRITLKASLFRDIEKGELIRVYINKKSPQKAIWRLSPKKSYFAMKTLYSMYKDYSSRPSIETIDKDLKLCKWKNADGKYVFSVWSNDNGGKIYNLILTGVKPVMYDYLGNIISTSSVKKMRISTEPIYIQGCSSIRIEE